MPPSTGTSELRVQGRGTGAHHGKVRPACDKQLSSHHSAAEAGMNLNLAAKCFVLVRRKLRISHSLQYWRFGKKRSKFAHTRCLSKRITFRRLRGTFRFRLNCYKRRSVERRDKGNSQKFSLRRVKCFAPYHYKFYGYAQEKFLFKTILIYFYFYSKFSA